MPEQRVVIRRRPIPAIPDDFPADLPPVLARLYAARGVTSAADLEDALAGLSHFGGMAGIDSAVGLLVEALQAHWRILVVGDFDADGATSTAVACRALRSLGAAEVDFLVPNRFEYGYGLTPEIVAVAAQRAPDLILTVDNGISSLEGVAAARAAGMRVLITDHHLPGPELPGADAIINPNRPGDRFPGKSLAGVGVVFYLMLALRTHLRGTEWFGTRGPEEPNLAVLLDLVALGTVADVVPLERDNRILVGQGLARIRAGRACCGVAALAEVSGREPARLTSADLGFALGPRLNAAGRLDDMSVGIRCLLSENMAEARALAAELDGLNRERRAIEETMRTEAMALLEALHLEERAELPRGLCLYDPGWHQGVIGILASRIKDQVHRPVIVFTDAGGGTLKGSARSVSGVHIRDVLDAIAARHPGLLSRFGGHAMAAGLSLPAAHYDTFTEAFAQEVGRHLREEDIGRVIWSDGELAPNEVDVALAERLRYAAPWGQGFPEPLFDGEFEVVQQRVVGGAHLKLALRWPGETGAPIDAIAFRFASLASEPLSRVRIAYRPDVNEYRGVRRLQFVIQHLEPA